MLFRSLILIFVCFWCCKSDSDSELLYDGSNITETHASDDPCINTDILTWENEIHSTFQNNDIEDPLVNTTRRGGRGGRRGRGGRKHPVMVKLRNKRGRRKLVSIKAELEYKIEIMNKLQTKVEVLLIVDFLNKSDCGVGALFKEDSDSWAHLKSNDSSICYSVQSSVEPRRRIIYPFHTPKCGCFTFRYHFAYREGNTTLIRSPDPKSSKPHKKLTKTFCVQSEEDSDGEGLIGMKKKHNRRRGKKGFFKKNRRMNRKEKALLRQASAGPSSRLTLSRSKKDTFQIWEAQGRHATINSSYLDLNEKKNVRNPSENRHEYEIIENEIDTDGIYNNDHPEEDISEENDEYDIENEDQSIEEEENNIVEDFGYEDINENEDKNINDYEQEDASEEIDSENVEVGNEINYDENIDEDDDESLESDEAEYHQYENTIIKADDLFNNDYIDKEHNNQNEIDKNCDSDESNESSEEYEDKMEVINDSKEALEAEKTKIIKKNTINSINTEYNNKNGIRRRHNFRRKPYAITYNNGIRHNRHSFPRRRMHSFRNRRKQNPPFTRTSPFKPWEESNRAKWQRKHEINVNNIKASSICCRQGVNRKKLILHNKLENNSEFNKTCDEYPQKILNWVENDFNITEEFCRQKFISCCDEWSLLSSNFRVPYYPMRREIFV